MKVILGDIAVVVSDAKASARWWKGKCGFEIRDNVGHWITVAPPGASVVIHLCGPDQGYPAETGNTGIGFFVDDLRKLHAAWSKKGVRFSKPPTQETASLNAMFADPDGNEYWLFEDTDLRVDVKGAKKAKAAKRAKKAKPARRAPAKKTQKPVRRR